MMKLTPALLINRDKIVQIAAMYGAQNVRVFGSFARGEAILNSDLDLLINLEAGRSLLDLIAVKQDLEDLLACSVDVVTEASLSPYIRDKILKEAVTL
jgi:predicted nucleotidyltransferase